MTGNNSSSPPPPQPVPLDPMVLMERFVKAMELTAGNRFKTNEPSTYDGTMDANVIDSWIDAVERYATVQGWSDDQTGLYAVTLLRGRANNWFRSTRKEKDALPGWLTLKRTLIAFFRPDDTTLIARDRLACLRQHSDLRTYIDQFIDIKLALPTMTDDDAADRFTRGLKDPKLRVHLRQIGTHTLNDAIHSAIAFTAGEERYNYTPTRRTQQYVDDPMDIDLLDDIHAMNNYSKKRQLNNTQYNNRSNSYNRNNNRFNYNNNNYNNSNITCYYCNKKGHIKSLCPTRRADIKALDEKRQRQYRKDFH